MVSFSTLTGLEDFVRESRLQGKTYDDISVSLRTLYPRQRGFSARTIRRFCKESEIHRTSRLPSTDLNRVVATAVSQVGPTYGRKTIRGLLRSQGIYAGDKQVGCALGEVHPSYHLKRLTRVESELNPHPYFARYFGHKLHIDQNEKVVMFGLTHVAAIDGYSRKIVGFITLPVKNNVEIYTHLFRPILIEYGLWDQIRVDQGKERVLSLFVQEHLAAFRTSTEGPPHLQSTSTMNHVVERIWVEINKRVNYPLKKALIDMENENLIKIHDNVNTLHRFCVSWLAVRVANVGASLAVEAWNEHSIPGHGIPNLKAAAAKQTSMVNPSLVPLPSDAVAEFTSSGGHLQVVSNFGKDPLDGATVLQQMRDATFVERYPSFKPIFHHLANSDCTLFREALIYFIQINERLSSTKNI